MMKSKSKYCDTELQMRAEVTSHNVKARTVKLAFSSEEPVDRGDYIEVLDHRPGAVDLNRLNNKHPFLVDHNWDDQIGCVEKAWLDDDHRCRCIVRFGNSPRADEMLRDITDGIRPHVSVGYKTTRELSKTTDAETGRPIIRFAWMPFEVSSVAIPADDTVGVGRGFTREGPKTMCPHCGSKAVKTALEADEEEAEEMLQCPDCNEVFSKNQIPAQKEEKSSHIEFIETRMNQQPARTALFGLTERDVKQFSISRALKDVVQGGCATGFEKEMLDEGRKRCSATGDVFVPPDVLVGVNRSSPLFRDLSTASANAGGQFVETTVGKSWVEILRNKLVTQRAGGQFLGGLQGNIKIPRQTGAAVAYVVGEQGLITKTTQTVDGIAGTPHRLGAMTAYAKELFLQSSVDVEDFLRDDLIKVSAVKMDLFALMGAGGPEPVGVRNTTGIGSVTFGGSATWAQVVSFETNVATQNADIGRLSYITSPTTRAKWKTAPQIAGYPRYLWEPRGYFLAADGSVADYPAFSTNQISDSTVCYGNWEDDVFCMWGGWDITVDPFSQAATATVNVIVNTFVDNIVRHAGSFCWSTDSGAQ